MTDVEIDRAPSPIGRLWLAGTGNGLLAIGIAADRDAFIARIVKSVHDARISGGNKNLDDGRSWLESYFSGKRPSSDSLPLDVRGTRFQRRIWAVLKKTPYGRLVTYGELSALAGAGSARAVGRAVGGNPLPIIIPCHRVIAAGGGLGGFGPGLEIKRCLLRHEGFEVEPGGKRVRSIISE